MPLNQCEWTDCNIQYMLIASSEHLLLLLHSRGIFIEIEILPWYLDWIFTVFAYFRWVNSQRLLVHCSKAPKNYSSLSSAISHDCLFATFVKHQATEQANDQHRKLESGSVPSALPRVSKMNLLIRYSYYGWLTLGVNQVFIVNSQTDAWDWMMIFQVAWYLYLTKFMQTQPCAEELGMAALYLPFYL